ncbi:MAG: hypothetical protein GX802_03885 [Clostridiales bacterium]|jgi:hypothetical protein|nr:hypothetical protein [Clostridiales bacterium]
MKKIALFFAFILVVTSILPAVSQAKEEYVTLNFKAELSNPFGELEGFGLLKEVVSGRIDMEFSYKIPKTLLPFTISKEEIPEVVIPQGSNGITFDGWDIDPEGYAVTEGITFTAKFSNEDTFPVTFCAKGVATSISEDRPINLYWFGCFESAAYTIVVTNGYELQEADIPTPHYNPGFQADCLGWDVEPIGQIITEATVFTEWYYPLCHVFFFNTYTGKASDQYVRVDDDAVPPEADEVDGYIFYGWDKPYTGVTEHTLYIYAVYYAYGDANTDSLINTGDAVTILKSVNGICELTEMQERLADINNDSVVNTGDAAALLIQLVGNGNKVGIQQKAYCQVFCGVLL